MNLARSTFYSPPMGQQPKDARIVEKIAEICVEYPRYGYRRVTIQLRREGFVVNHKKALRIMREQGLSVRPQRRYVTTTAATTMVQSSQILPKASCRRGRTSSGLPISPTSRSL